MAKPRAFFPIHRFRRHFSLAVRATWAIDWDGAGWPSRVVTWGAADVDQIARDNRATDPDDAGYPDCERSFRHECQAVRVGIGAMRTLLDPYEAARRGPVGSASRVLHPDPGPCNPRTDDLPASAHDWLTVVGSLRGSGGGVAYLQQCRRCQLRRHTDTWASDHLGNPMECVTYEQS